MGIVLLCDAYGDAITDLAALDTSIQPFFDGAGHNTAFNISQVGSTQPKMLPTVDNVANVYAAVRPYLPDAQQSTPPRKLFLSRAVLRLFFVA